MESRLTRAVSAAAFGVVALLFGVTSLAWACTGDSFAPSVSTAAGAAAAAAGAPVRVHGENWRGEVVLHWDDRAGVVIGRAVPDRSRNFSAVVAIPRDAEPGPHLIFAVHSGEYNWTPFEVTAAEASGPGTQASDAETASGGAIISSSTPAPSEQPAAVPARAPRPARPPGAAPAPVVPAAVDAPSGPQAGAGGVANTPPSGSVPAVGAPGEARQNLLATTSARAAAPSAEPAPIPAATAASGDLWGGFATGTATDYGLTRLPASASAGPGSGLAMGMALFVGGMMSLLAGFGLAETRRRRSPVRVGRSG